MRFVLILTLFLPVFVLGLNIPEAQSQIFNSITYSETDTEAPGRIFFFFDLRERESYIQLTLPDTNNTNDQGQAHIQIFDVSNNCNENDFFDIYTPTDTHVYNMRNIETNDGNPSGVVLPDGAYGIVAISMFNFQSGFYSVIGNLRILDQSGYEYRTNGQAIFNFLGNLPDFFFYSFNFSDSNGVVFSDVVGVTVRQVVINNGPVPVEFDASDVTNIFTPLDVDIYDNNETVFSCRDIIFSCINENNPRLEELLENASTASVASFDYGINDSIPHSKGGELLCPANIISEGTVILGLENQSEMVFFLGFVGLNNGNSRGSLDSFFVSENFFLVSDL